MATARATICNKKGLHARAAAKLVKTASTFDAQIEIIRLPRAGESAEDAPRAGATSILSLLMLGSDLGSQIELHGEGAQAEVADRLAAEPGSRVYGIPSVKARYFGRVSRAGAVGRNVFWPEPKVESGLVRIDRTDDYPRDAQERRRVFEVIDAAFAQRRKTLRAALAGWAGSPVEAERRLRAAGIDPSARGERLGIADYVALAQTALP